MRRLARGSRFRMASTRRLWIPSPTTGRACRFHGCVITNWMAGWPCLSPVRLRRIPTRITNSNSFAWVQAPRRLAPQNNRELHERQTTKIMNQSEIIKFLKGRAGLWQHFSDERLKELVEQSRVSSYEIHEAIIGFGDDPTFLGVVLEGNVSVS